MNNSAPNQSNRTKAANAGLNLTLDPVEKFIFKGMQRRFLEVFEAKAIWVTSTDKVKLLQKEFGTGNAAGATDINVTYPYVFLTLGTVATSEARGNIKALSVYGMQTPVVVEDAKRAFRVKILPVDFTVSAEFVTNNYQDVLRYVNTWMFARTSGWLRFSVQYGTNSFAVSSEMDASLTIPQREADLTNIQDYVVTSNLVMQGHMSFATLQEQQVVDTVEVTTALGPQSDSTTTWGF